MIAAIVGGRLQGIELACLTRYAGWRILLVDRNNQVPAKPLCDRFLQLDVERSSALTHAFADVDIIIPALENKAALDSLSRWGCRQNVPVAFDPAAYGISSSKIASNRLFASLRLPIPDPWPQCGFPVVVKPSHASGSDGVMVLKTERDAAALFPNGLPDHGWVVQQYLAGPSFSLEVIGRPSHYLPLQITQLHMDAVYDCKRVAAPCPLTEMQRREIETMGIDIAEAIQLKGLMDVEVILHDGRFKVLEIDARFPSQTPLTVYHSTGLNMFEMLTDLYLRNKLPQRPLLEPARGVILEHVRVTQDTMFLEGEHIMSDAGPLHRVTDFFGADEAITNYQKGATQWVATLVVTGSNREHVGQKRKQVLTAIKRRFGVDTIMENNTKGEP